MSSPIPVPTPDEHISSDEHWSMSVMPVGYNWLLNTPAPQEVSLHQFGWSVETVGGSRYSIPTKRGENRRYPYRPGTRHNKNKLPDERTVDLLMWMNAVHPGTGREDSEKKLRWNDNWNFLRELFYSWTGNQLILTRRWWQTIEGVAVLHKASALVEMIDSMEPTMTGRYRANFSASLLMADPFFYGDTITQRIERGETVSIYNPGQERSLFENIQIKFRGGLWRPRLTNNTPEPPVWINYEVGQNGTTTIDVPNFLATYGNGTNMIRYVNHAGSRFWFGLVPGANLVTLSESTLPRPATVGTTGYAEVIFRPPYL